MVYISALIKTFFLALVGADMAAAYACSNAGPASVRVLRPPIILLLPYSHVYAWIWPSLIVKYRTGPESNLRETVQGREHLH